MLTLMANTSKRGAVWCLIEMPVLIGNFPFYMGHAPFILPPNDGVMYDLKKYGPVGTSTEIGHLYGTYGHINQPNPVDHLHVNGCLSAPGNAYGDNVTLHGGSWTLLGRAAPCDDGKPIYSIVGYLSPKGRYWTYDRFGKDVLRQNTTFVNQESACPSLCQPSVTPLVPNSSLFRPNMQYFTAISGHTWDYAHHVYDIHSSFHGAKEYYDYRRRRYFTRASTAGPPYWYQTNEYSTTYTFIGIRGNTSGSWTLRANYKRTETIRMYEGTKNETKNIVTSAGVIDLRLRAVAPGLAKQVDFPDLSRLAAHLDFSRLIMNRLYSPEYVRVARNNAMSNVYRLSSNNLENASQLSGSLSVLKDLINGYHAVTSGDMVGAVKAVSGAYLWYCYAAAPGKSDATEMINKTDGLVGFMKSKRFLSTERQRGTFVPPTSNAEWTQIYYCTIHSSLNNDCFAKLWTYLSRLGLQPTLGQGWDFVPFSFVVDWFLEVGPVLRQIEDYFNMKYLRDVEAVIETFNVKRLVACAEVQALTDWEVLGDYTEVLYCRHISSVLGDFDPLAGQSESGLSLSQMAQGGSLLIQQLD